jgi:predicted O-methyltransferase YrrM
MSTELTRNQRIKDYISILCGTEDDVLAPIKEEAKAHDLPDIHVPAHVGKLIHLIARLSSPKRVLEIGTLAGYSTIWLARALPVGGKLITIEGVPLHAEIAEENLKRAGLAESVEVRIGNAEATLKKMIETGEEPFDLIFIDADKENYPRYLELSLSLAKPGTVILADNLIPKGRPDEINSPHPKDLDARAIYAFNKAFVSHPKLDSVLATTIVGESGRVDALGISIVK